MNGTNGWWTEIWSLGRGANRLYCGIARTEDGFAVDVFRGDTCVDSWIFETREAAVKAAAAQEHRHARQSAPTATHARAWRLPA
jgi:hypothetical protein